MRAGGRWLSRAAGEEGWLRARARASRAASPAQAAVAAAHKHKGRTKKTKAKTKTKKRTKEIFSVRELSQRHWAELCKEKTK